MKNAKKIGGIAALGHTAALVVGMVLSFTLMFPLLDAAPDQASIFLAGNQALAYLWNLIVNWGSAITLVIMLLVLYERLKPGSPALLQAAVFFGILWAGLTIGTGDLMLHNFGVVANLYGSFPAQAAAWTVLARSLWVLLLSLAAVRKGRPFKSPGYLGVFLGIVGSLTLIPPVAEPMFMIFGPGMMIWSAWIGIVMLRNPVPATSMTVGSCRVTAIDMGKPTENQWKIDGQSTVPARLVLSKDIDQRRCTHSITEVGRK